MFQNRISTLCPYSWQSQVLLDSISSSETSYPGVHTIAYAFPQVKIVTTAVDPEINDKFHVLPGIGNFGDRWVDCNILQRG